MWQWEEIQTLSRSLIIFEILLFRQIQKVDTTDSIWNNRHTLKRGTGWRQKEKRCTTSKRS